MFLTPTYESGSYSISFSNPFVYLFPTVFTHKIRQEFPNSRRGNIGIRGETKNILKVSSYTHDYYTGAQLRHPIVRCLKKLDVDVIAQ